MKRRLITVAWALVALLGLGAVVFGEADDSPGLQGLGVILAGVAVMAALRSQRRPR